MDPLTAVADALVEVGRTLRLRAPRARILFVDYLTMLPPPGVDASPLSKSDADVGRHVAETLERHTAEAAAATGCEIVRAGEANRAHHAWSTDRWTTKGAVPLPGRPFPFHPAAVGMRAVAELVAAQVSSPYHREAHHRAEGLTEAFGRHQRPARGRFDHNRSTAASKARADTSERAMRIGAIGGDKAR